MLKSFAGLSASVFTAVYLAAFRPDAAAFLACVAAAPVLLGAIALPLFNAVPFAQDAAAEAPAVAGVSCSGVVPAHACTSRRRVGVATCSHRVTGKQGLQQGMLRQGMQVSCGAAL